MNVLMSAFSRGLFGTLLLLLMLATPLHADGPEQPIEPARDKPLEDGPAKDKPAEDAPADEDDEGDADDKQPEGDDAEKKDAEKKDAEKEDDEQEQPAATRNGHVEFPIGRGDCGHPVLKAFQICGKYRLHKGDERLRKSAIYRSHIGKTRMLVQTGYPGVLLLRQRTMEVQRITVCDILRRSDGLLFVRQNAKIETIGKFTRSGGTLSFKAGNLSFRLEPNPPLLEWHDRDAVLEHTPEYSWDAESYRIDKAVFERLKAHKDPVVVSIYFGSWCHGCSRVLGRILRVEEELARAGSKVTFRYYGLPEGRRAMRKDALAKKHSIEKLPTGVIEQESEQIGRVVSSEWTRPERALERVLSEASQG
ncbi:MAG: hypothetical protein GY946_15815 [bacterium]|nr:hypothetical protein [bacterium]